ncbi:hypothetical protein [Devosia sp. FKR38]|uniref:hypothetical protein n=1 Tax=Devosia sp. FKR38 TaxID=2562312 RepID=UPI001484FBEB|nr:hypothetical protein [Devosia sp. FKR38]
MSQPRVDFAIVGATPLARLLAGLLAGTHGRSVLLQGESHAGYRLPRHLDLSIGAITRPATWALLGDIAPEVRRLVTRIGKRAAVARLDPLLVARSAAGQAALGHVRHMAAAFGHAAEPFRGRGLPDGSSGVLLRDAILLQLTAADAAVDEWLRRQGVERLSESEMLTVHADGSGLARRGDQTIAIGQTILADDAALLAHLPQSQWPDLLVRQAASTVLTGAVPPLPARVLHDLDTGLWVHQQAGGIMVACGPGSTGTTARRLASLLGDTHRFEQAGQSGYTSLVTRDGAPAVGRSAGMGPDVLVGFGPIGGVLAPAIARWLCGAATPAESAWMGSHLVNRCNVEGAASVRDLGVVA